MEQGNDYYPFGLTFNSYSRENSLYHWFFYQNKEWLDDFDINLYDFEWRQYDPVMARTTTMDPHADTYALLSPYSWAANNPVTVVDPDGRDIVDTSIGTTYTGRDAQRMFRQLQLRHASSSTFTSKSGLGTSSFSVGFSAYKNEQRGMERRVYPGDAENGPNNNALTHLVGNSLNWDGAEI